MEEKHKDRYIPKNKEVYQRKNPLKEFEQNKKVNILEDSPKVLTMHRVKNSRLF